MEAALEINLSPLNASLYRQAIFALGYCLNILVTIGALFLTRWRPNIVNPVLRFFWSLRLVVWPFVWWGTLNLAMNPVITLIVHFRYFKKMIVIHHDFSAGLELLVALALYVRLSLRALHSFGDS